MTPFLHSLDFQPMVHDLLSADIVEKGTKIKNLNSSEEKRDELRAMPDENDQVWVKYRHQYIGEVLNKLPAQFNEWQKQNAVAKMKRSGDENKSVKTKELILAARDMPQYQKLVKQYTTNINMAHKLMSIYKESGLTEIVQLEQDMATGIDQDGKKIDRTLMQKQFSSVLLDGDKPLSLKLRTFMLYVISQGGMKPEQRRTLLKQSGFDDDTEDVIVNLGCLGVQLTSNKPGTQSGGCKQYWKEVTKAAKDTANTDKITRHTSYLQWALKGHHGGSLKEDDFQWVTKPGKQAKSQIKFYRRHAKKKEDDSAGKGPRYIVYFLGGVSYAEIKTCYEFARTHDVDIFVGSTLVYSPQEYLRCFDGKQSAVEEQKGDQLGADGRECRVSSSVFVE